MTHISGIRLRNFACFRGEHELQLQPLTYAVTARDQRNHERSNWLGKSTFLASIRFALTGRYDDGATAWISRGETEGGVDLELDDTTYVSRGRGPKGSTQLLVITPEGRELRQTDAEQWLAKHLLDPETWDLSYHVRQDAISRLLTMGAAERTEVVAGWAGLDRFDAALDLIGDRDDAEAAKESRIRGELSALEQVRSPDELTKEVEKLERETAELEAKLHAEQERETMRANYLTQQRRLARVVEQKRDLVEVEKLVARIPAVEKELAETTADLTRLREWMTTKRSEVSRLRVLAEGSFDGACPVQKGFSCPARDPINAKREENGRAHRKVEEELRRAPEAQAFERQQTREKELQSEARTLRSSEGTAIALRRSIEAAEEETPRWPSPPLEADVETAMVRYNGAVQRLGVARQELKHAQQARHRVAVLQGELKSIEEKRHLLRGAAIVYGRNGAQKRLVEGVIGAIRDRSNSALQSAGVELAIDVTWGREGKKLERICSVCGYGYGNSQAAKKCGSCGAERQKTFDPRLDIALSSESGGARDIAGLLLQLSAARWLRGVRQMPWATYLIDEPFGAIDRANRLALAARLHSVMHREFGSEQALIVAHDADTLNALPGRIEITSDGKWSSVAVL